MKTISRIAMAGAFGIAMAGIALAQDAKELNFGIISTESQQNLKTQWEPFLADMAKQTGLEVKPFFASDYAGVIEGMRFGKVDVRWYGNKSAIEAVDRANGEVVRADRRESGEPGLLLADTRPGGQPAEFRRGPA
jgi:phosphonate transport system substrate-binding protein